jgi:4-hydroxybenzoate polyprenyltransferase and related prenyltransferases
MQKEVKMAEQTVQTVHIDVTRLERKIDALSATTEQLSTMVNNTNMAIETANHNIAVLTQKFQEMANDQKRQAALQQAATELVQTRQELEQNYGNYKIIRQTMLGVLQATDLALVKKATISRVSEELMLSTPTYWLAPCLVAVAAWIGNDRDLAQRAIAEAVKRDEERTAITMALICRRNNRVETCYEWLSIYFSHQNAANFSEGSFAYIDAYINGVFGPDKKHMCDDYVMQWMNEIRGSSSNFEASQEKIWKEYCSRFSLDISHLYPDLDGTVTEYDSINEYVSRILAVDPIAENLTGINNAYIDQNRLKAKIDESLIQLISRYNEDEEPLRKEEKYLLAIKHFEGDKEAAKQSIIKAEQKRKQQTLNLVEQMSHVILTDKDTSPSERKTAVSFLSGYIRKGFQTYITEKKDTFPNQITMKVDGWTGTSEDGSNAEELCRAFEAEMTTRRAAELEKAKRSNEKAMMISAIVLAVLGVICLFAMPPFGVILLAGAAVLVYFSFRTKKTTAEKIEAIGQDYANRIENGKAKINQTTAQWKEAKGIVYQFENNPVREIIA